MRTVYRWLVVLLVCMPHAVGAISWNPLTWFAEEQKKHDVPWIRNYWKTFQKSYAYRSACNHPQQVVIAGSALCVTILLRSFTKLQATLQKNNAWAHWKRDALLVHTKNDTTVTHELLHEIQIRYMKLHAITDFMGPIRSFMADVTQERNDLRRYARYARWLQNCGLYCCVDAELVSQVDERIERLETLQGLCVQWLAKTKLDPVLA